MAARRWIRALRLIAVPIRANRDAVAYIEAGFVGPWGEFHSSDLDTPKVAHDLVSAWIAEVPGIFVNVRRPDLKQAGFSADQLRWIGHYNDCFLFDPDHRGTYRGSDAIKK